MFFGNPSQDSQKPPIKTIQGTVSLVESASNKFSQNIKLYQFLKTKLISDAVNEIKELRTELINLHDINKDFPSKFVEDIIQNDSTISGMITKINTHRADRIRELNTKIESYGFVFKPQLTAVEQSIRSGISDEIANINTTLQAQIKNVIELKVEEIQDELSKLYITYLNDTLNLDKINTPGYYDSVIKIATTIFTNKLKENGYLNKNDTITDAQLDVLLRLNGIQFSSYFSHLKPANITVAPGTIYIGEGKIKSKKSGTLFGYSIITKNSFLNSNGVISDSNNQYTWKINYSKPMKLDFQGHNGGRFTKRNYKSNKPTKNKRSNQKKTRKSSN